MTQIPANTIHRLAALARKERGSTAVEHALIAGGGSGTIVAVAYPMADVIERGFRTILAVMP